MPEISRSPADIGNILRNARRAQKLSQQDLARRAGVWPRTISLIESGAGGAKLDTLFDLLAALDLELQIAPRSRGAAPDVEEIF